MATKPPKSGRRRNKLTPRRARFIKELVKGKSLTQAAVNAGYSEKNAGQSGHQTLTRIQQRMPEVLESHGLTDDILIEKYLKPLMNAKETVFAKFEGEITDRCDVIAWGPRRDGLDLAFKLKGSYAASTEEGRGPSVQVIVLDVVTPDRSAITVKSADPSGNG